MGPARPVEVAESPRFWPTQQHNFPLPSTLSHNYKRRVEVSGRCNGMAIFDEQAPDPEERRDLIEARRLATSLDALQALAEDLGAERLADLLAEARDALVALTAATPSAVLH